MQNLIDPGDYVPTAGIFRGTTKRLNEMPVTELAKHYTRTVHSDRAKDPEISKDLENIREYISAMGVDTDIRKYVF